MKVKFISVYSSIHLSIRNYKKPFEERIEIAIGKENDLDGIKGGYDTENPQFKDAKFRVLTEEEADKIIKKYNEAMKGIEKE